MCYLIISTYVLLKVLFYFVYTLKIRTKYLQTLIWFISQSCKNCIFTNYFRYLIWESQIPKCLFNTFDGFCRKFRFSKNFQKFQDILLSKHIGNWLQKLNVGSFNTILKNIRKVRDVCYCV